MNRTFRWVSLAALLLLISTAIQAAPAAGGVGVLDLSKVFQGYIGSQVANQVMTEFQTKAMESAKIIYQGIGLDTADFDQYNKLMSKEVRNEEEIKKLEEKSQANSKKHSDLQTKMMTALSAEEKTEFQESFQTIIKITSQDQGMVSDADASELKQAEEKYSALETKGKSALTADEQKDYDLLHPVFKANLKAFTRAQMDFSQAMEEKGKKIQEKFTAELDKAIDKVAKSLKLSAIVSKNVQPSQGTTEKIVLWSDAGADITEKVVKELNANFKPDMFK